MEYRNTLLDVARRTLSRPTEPSLGLLGLFEDANRLAVRLNWLKKDTHRFRKIRTLLIVLLVGLMLACVLPMAQAEDTPATPQTASASAAVVPAKAKDEIPDGYAELIHEIETLKQGVIQTETSDVVLPVSVTVTDPASGSKGDPAELTDQDRKAMQQKLEALTQQQQALAQQLEQLKAELGRAETDKIQHEGLTQKLQAQLKHLDTARETLKDAKQRMAESERLQTLVKSLDEMGAHVDHWVDSNGMQVWVKKYAGKLPHEVIPQIQQWTDSKEFKAWQQDMKAWEKDMQAWSQEMARALEDTFKDFKPKDMTFDLSPPKMPAMPKLPAMPFLRDTPPDAKVELIVPAAPSPHSHVNAPPKVNADVVAPPRPLPKLMPLQERHVRIESHVMTPGIKDGPEFNARCIKAMTLSFPDDDYDTITLNNPMGDITVIGTDGHQCTAQIEITSKAKDPDTAKALIDQVHITSSREDQTLIITPSVPDNDSEAQVIVTFIVKVPKAWPLNLKTEVGDVTLRNIVSQVNCIANVGDICVHSDANPTTLNAQTNVGDICLAVAPNTDAMISASSQVGKIHSKQAFTMSPTQMTGAKGTLTLGSGKARVNLKVNVGSIYVGPTLDLDKVTQPQGTAEARPDPITIP